MFIHKYSIDGETIYRITGSKTPGNMTLQGEHESIFLSESKEHALKRFQSSLQEKEEEKKEETPEQEPVKTAKYIPLAEILRVKAQTLSK
jgi:hypothetical protein